MFLCNYGLNLNLFFFLNLNLQNRHINFLSLGAPMAQHPLQIDIGQYMQNTAAGFWHLEHW